MYTKLIQPLTTRRQLFWMFKAAILFVLVVIVLAISMPAIERQLSSWRVLPSAQPLTELYFTNPNELSSHFTPDQPFATAFTVSSHDQRPDTYTYTITESNEELTNTRVLATGSVAVAHDGTVTVTKTVTPAAMGSRRAYISIMVNDITIGYWITQE